jgi:hypothetical protein
MSFRGTPPETPGREGFSLSALSLGAGKLCGMNPAVFRMGSVVRVSGVGVVAATWASFVPPARPRKVKEDQGDTP